MRSWMILAPVLLAACDVTWDTPLVVGAHEASYVGDACGPDQGSLEIEEMVLTPVEPYGGAFELSYVRGDKTWELYDCIRGSAAGDTVSCSRGVVEGAVEPPLALMIGFSGWVEAETVDYTLAQALFCGEEDETMCEGLLPEEGVCDMSLQGSGPIEE